MRTKTPLWRAQIDDNDLDSLLGQLSRYGCPDPIAAAGQEDNLLTPIPSVVRGRIVNDPTGVPSIELAIGKPTQERARKSNAWGRLCVAK